jgi:transaldolase
MPISNLHGLAAAGVSVWSDQISRRMLDTGELTRRAEHDAVTGVTSNPTIFAAAVGGSDDYTDQLMDLKSAGVPTEEIVKALMADDIRRACDVLTPIHDSTSGVDGYVSVEVDPYLAAETEATIAEARDWVKQVDRDNLLVKVPATPEGIPAIRALIGEGVSVNVTLIFSLARYREVIDAYMSGLEDLADVGGDMASVASVASFFVSRFDTEVDPRLEAVGSNDAHDLRGHLAVANARAAYGIFMEAFATPRFEALSAQGARPQRPLWASTSTKNPAYSDLLYVENLVAKDTVNTMPLATIDAYQDHGDPEPSTFDAVDIVRANDELEKLGTLGVDYRDVVDTLEREGVEKFQASWQELLDRVDSA